MKIEELSNTLDEKLAEAERKLQALHQLQASTTDAQATQTLGDEIAALSAIQQKLLKSRAIAWQVHELNQQTAADTRSIERQRRLGLGLCVISAVALVVVAWVAYGMYF